MNEKSKPMSIARAITTARLMRTEMAENCPATPEVQRYLAAVDRLVDYVTTPSDRWVANIYLLILGVTLLALGAVCGAAGCWYAFHGAAEAVVVGEYAAGFFGAGLLSLVGVRK